MIRFIIAAIFIIAGVIIIASATLGNFRFGYVLNRMQVGATADTLGTMLVILGLIIISGINTISLKLIVMILFMWIANPVQSHFLARTEIISNEKITEECEVVNK